MDNKIPARPVLIMQPNTMGAGKHRHNARKIDKIKHRWHKFPVNIMG